MAEAAGNPGLPGRSRPLVRLGLRGGLVVDHLAVDHRLGVFAALERGQVIVKEVVEEAHDLLAVSDDQRDRQQDEDGADEVLQGPDRGDVQRGEEDQRQDVVADVGVFEHGVSRRLPRQKFSDFSQE